MQADLIEIDADNRLLLISPITNAADDCCMLIRQGQNPPRDNTLLKGVNTVIPSLRIKYLEVLKNGKDLIIQTISDKNVPGNLRNVPVPVPGSG